MGDKTAADKERGVRLQGCKRFREQPRTLDKTMPYLYILHELVIPLFLAIKQGMGDSVYSDAKR